MTQAASEAKSQSKSRSRSTPPSDPRAEAGSEPSSEPNWDLTPYFPELDGPAYRSFRDDLASDLAALAAALREIGPLAPDRLGRFADLLLRLEDVSARMAHLGSYLACRSAADSRDERVARERAAHASRRAQLDAALAIARGALAAADEALFAELLGDEGLSGAGYRLERLRKEGAFALAPDLESLAADLDVTGVSAWGRLYDQVSGRLELELEDADGATRRLPVSMTRSLLEDADAHLRSAAFRGANRAWAGVSDVAAACLNAIAGARLTLQRWRGVSDFLEPALFDAGIERGTLDTLLSVVESKQEVARRFLRAKARRLGRERLGWQDLLAPEPVAQPARIPYREAQDLVLRAFGAFHPRLEAFARHAFERRWIDHDPRPGKRPGGFCSSSPLLGESRVFLTFGGALGDVLTLAHELGHAFHGHVMRDLRPWARRYPMTLAETASTFAEGLVSDAVLESAQAGADEKALVLDARLRSAAVFLLDIPVRFRFEQALYSERADGELPVSRLCELMLDAQRRAFGDALAEDELNPWFWASKLHFYLTGVSFYNFPYTFGYLFSQGITARARAEGGAFLERYEALLRLTGSDTAENVAQRGLGADLRAPDFWLASIARIEADLERYLDRPD